MARNSIPRGIDIARMTFVPSLLCEFVVMALVSPVAEVVGAWDVPEVSVVD